MGWKGYERFPIKFRWAILFYTKYQIPNTEGPFWRSCLEHASEISVNFHPSPNLGRVLFGRPPTSQKRGDHSEEAALKQGRGEDCDKGVKWVLPFPTAVPDDWVFPHCGTNLGFTISHPGNSGRLRFCHAVCHLWQIYYTKYTNTQKYTNIQKQTASHTNNYKSHIVCIAALYFFKPSIKVDFIVWVVYFCVSLPHTMWHTGPQKKTNKILTEF